jgi:hypothetical protein
MSINETIKLIRQDYWNLWYFWQGTIRQWLFENYPILIRDHILEQYFWRIMQSSDCSKNKSCIVCGCKTDDLFFSNKGCALNKIKPENWKIFSKESPCYPPMMNKSEWKEFKALKNIEL